MVAAALARLGIPHQTGVGGTGVVGTIGGGAPGPTLAIRADMDALPIAEQTGLPFASSNAGLMHACGHDLHTATLLGVADVLHGLAPQLRGAVRLIFQPAEEIGQGAVAMMQDGALDGVAMALGFHNKPEMAVGRVGVAPGPALASVDLFDITVGGRSGHAAYPHTTVDPVVAAATLVLQLQTVVSRELPPMRPAVVTVGAIAGGTVHNIIPDSVVLKGTVRTLDPDTRAAAEQSIRRLCAGLEAGMRVQVAIRYARITPPLVNDAHLAACSMASMQAQFGDAQVDVTEPSMGGEDFAAMTERVPGVAIWVGAGAPGRCDKLHNSNYQPDEACLAHGVAALSRIALDLLS